MPGIDIEEHQITFSQSWLDTYLECPEKARASIGVVDPDADYHVTGTTLHTFAEGVLMGDSILNARMAAMDWFEEQVENKTFEYVKVKTPTTMRRHIESCMTAWETDVLRHLTPPRENVTAHIERSFDMPLCITPSGIKLRLKGTYDYHDPYIGLMDWKTAGREWKASDMARNKAKWDIQPTAYTLGLAWLHWGDEVWTFADDEQALHFTWCIHMKRPNPAPVEWVQCTRGPADWRHLQRVALSAAKSIEHEVWPVIDQSNLCQPRFCPNWDNCKGSQTIEAQPHLRLIAKPDTNNQGEQE